MEKWGVFEFYKKGFIEDIRRKKKKVYIHAVKGNVKEATKKTRRLLCSGL